MVSSATISAGWSGRSPTTWASSSGKVVGSPTSEAGDGVRTVPRIGGGAHGGEPHVPGPAPLEELDHEPEGWRGVDPARAGPAADAGLVGQLGAGRHVRVAVGLVVVADDGDVVQAVLAPGEQVAED